MVRYKPPHLRVTARNIADSVRFNSFCHPKTQVRDRCVEGYPALERLCDQLEGMPDKDLTRKKALIFLSSFPTSSLAEREAIQLVENAVRGKHLDDRDLRVTKEYALFSVQESLDLDPENGKLIWLMGALKRLPESFKMIHFENASDLAEESYLRK